MAQSRFTITIGNKRYSSWSLRPWLALKHVTNDYKENVIFLSGVISPKTDTARDETLRELLKYSPTGLVPALYDKMHDVTVYDSLAIIMYLADQFPNSGLFPANPVARALCFSACAEMHSGFTNIRHNMSCLFVNLGRKQGIVALQNENVLSDINRIGNLWTDLRKRYLTEGPYLFGKFGAADCMFAPIVSRFLTYDPDLFSLTSYPVAQQYIQTISEHESYQEWISGARLEPLDTRVEKYEKFSDDYNPAEYL